MKICAVVAMSQNRVIGKDNRLPWKIPEDLKRFKAITLGHPVVMGRKTFDSIGRPLPGRENWVISKQENLQIPGALTFPSVEAALQHGEEEGIFDQIFIIGGAQIYAQTLHRVERLYLTLVHQEIEGDAFFPEYEGPDFEGKNLSLGFKEVSREDRADPVPLSFIVLDKV